MSRLDDVMDAAIAAATDAEGHVDHDAALTSVLTQLTPDEQWALAEREVVVEMVRYSMARGLPFTLSWPFEEKP